MAVLRCLVYCLVCLITIESSCVALKFVMAPCFGRSHYLVLARVEKELTARGHEVVLLVGDCFTYAAKDVNVRWFKCTETMKTLDMKNIYHMPQLMHDYCDAKFSDQAIMKEIKSADLVIGDGMYMCSALIADKFSLPHVTILESSLTSATNTMPYNVAELPSYLPQFSSGMTENMNFLQRAKNTLYWFKNRVLTPLLFKTAFLDVKKKYNITPEKSFEQTLQRVDLILIQTEAFDYPRPLVPNIKSVGPLLASPTKPLPDDLEEFVKGAGDKGVILVSFGSILGDIGDDKIKEMAAVFSRVPQKVIWKINTEGRDMNLSSNVKASTWLPQNDILGHPNTRLFIGHAGMNGLMETGYHGVPMICVPFFGDQFDNAVAAKHLGMAEILYKELITEENLAKAINTVLNNPSYQQSAARISKMIKQHPHTPVQQAADWIEYTQAMGGLPHLRPRGLDMPFYQLYLLDVIFVASLVLMGTFAAVYFLIRYLCRICFKSKPNKEKLH